MAEVLDEYRDTQYKFIILSNQDDERDTALAASASGFVVTGSRPEHCGRLIAPCATSHTLVNGRNTQ